MHGEHARMPATPASGVIELGMSRALVTWVMGAGLGALALVLVYLPAPAAAGAGCLLLLLAWHDLRVHALRRHPDALVALQYGDGGFAVKRRSGAWHDVTLLRGVLVTPWLTVARLRDTDDAAQRRVLVVCADGVDRADYRRLRMYLRWCWRDPAAAHAVKV